MTAIIGVKTNDPKNKSIVLGADTQLSFELEGKPFKRKPIQKIIYGRNWALAYAGTIDQGLNDFLASLHWDCKKKNILDPEKAEKVIRTAMNNYFTYKKNNDFSKIHFKEINTLNAKFLRKEEIRLEDLYTFILAIYHPKKKLNLFEIDEFGNLKEPKDKEFSYVTIGTGSEAIEKYIEELAYKDESSQFLVDTGKAIDIVCDSLKKAEKTDISISGPIDLIVLDSNGVHDYGKEIRDAIYNAEGEAIKGIKENYKTD